MLHLKKRNNPKPHRLTLDWLFIAYLKDGSIIEQTQEDKCTTRTDGTGSAFTDVLAHQDELIAFELHNIHNGNWARVDLATGNFVVNDVPICAHDQFFEPQRHKLKLIYFRETRAERTQTVQGETVGERHFVNRYFIGWETSGATKNIKQTIAVG